MLRRVKEDNWSITNAAAAFGFSRPSFYEAQSEFEHAGLVSFIPEKRGPREAHKLSGEVVKFIEECKVQDATLKTPDVVRLVKEKFGIDVHRRSLERALSRSKKNLRNRRCSEGLREGASAGIRRTSTSNDRRKSYQESSQSASSYLVVYRHLVRLVVYAVAASIRAG